MPVVLVNSLHNIGGEIIRPGVDVQHLLLPALASTGRAAVSAAAVAACQHHGRAMAAHLGDGASRFCCFSYRCTLLLWVLSANTRLLWRCVRVTTVLLAFRADWNSLAPATRRNTVPSITVHRALISE